MASDAKIDVKISADVSEFQAGIIRSLVATLDDEGRAALLDALLQERGYEKRLAMQIMAMDDLDDDSARVRSGYVWWYDEDDDLAEHIYVPVQGEGE